MSKEAISKIYLVLEKIEYIEEIVIEWIIRNGLPNFKLICHEVIDQNKLT